MRVLIIVSILGVFAAFLTITGRIGTTEINPHDPSFAFSSEPPWTANATSTVSLDVMILPSAINTLIERLVPRQELGSKQEDFGRAFSNEQVSWNLHRTDIEVSTIDSLGASAEVSGTVRAKGNDQANSRRYRTFIGWCN